MTPISIIILIFSLFALSRVILRTQDKSISFKESLLWVIIWITIATFTIVPQATDKLSLLFGVGRGVDTAFFLSIIFLFYIIFRLYIKIDELDKNITTLTINSSKEINSLKNNKNNL